MKDKEQPNKPTIETPEDTFKRIKEKYFLVPLNEEGHKYWANKESLFAIVSDYHTERTRIEAQQPKKTFQDCKDEVARTFKLSKEGKTFKNWDDMEYHCPESPWLIERMEEAAELYASQFQTTSTITVVTDEEIENAFPLNCETGLLDQGKYITGAKWMRNKLTGGK